MSSVNGRIIRLGAVGRRDPVANDQTIRTRSDLDPVTVAYVTGQQHLGQRVLQRPLNDPL